MIILMMEMILSNLIVKLIDHVSAVTVYIPAVQLALHCSITKMKYPFIWVSLQQLQMTM